MSGGNWVVSGAVWVLKETTGFRRETVGCQKGIDGNQEWVVDLYNEAVAMGVRMGLWLSGGVCCVS